MDVRLTALTSITTVYVYNHVAYRLLQPLYTAYSILGEESTTQCNTREYIYIYIYIYYINRYRSVVNYVLTLWQLFLIVRRLQSSLWRHCIISRTSFIAVIVRPIWRVITWPVGFAACADQGRPMEMSLQSTIVVVADRCVTLCGSGLLFPLSGKWWIRSDPGQWLVWGSQFVASIQITRCTLRARWPVHLCLVSVALQCWNLTRRRKARNQITTPDRCMRYRGYRLQGDRAPYAHRSKTSTE